MKEEDKEEEGALVDKKARDGSPLPKEFLPA
jgi:hypothetical protein